MMISKLLDILSGKVPKPKSFLEIPVSPERRAEGIERLRLAEKFDFGELVLEEAWDPELMMPYNKVPSLTPEEHEFLDKGLVPLPAPNCWYEFALNGHVSGLLVMEGWEVMRFDYDRHQNSGCADWVSLKQSGTGDPHAFIFDGNMEFIRKQFDEDALRPGSMRHGGNWSLARYFTLMIGSKTTKRVYVDGCRPVPSTALEPGKREPRYSHHVVTIVPREYFIQARKEGEALRLPPRLHWRRSHLRHLNNGKVIVIPRMLVGRAELGAVSHEYKVKEGPHNGV